LIKVGENMVIETGREETGRWKARRRWGKQTDLAEAKADPTVRMNCIIVEGGSRRTHMKFPGLATPTQSKIGEIGTTIKVGGQGNENDEA
jgi:hypothetical protein